MRVFRLQTSQLTNNTAALIHIYKLGNHNYSSHQVRFGLLIAGIVMNAHLF